MGYSARALKGRDSYSGRERGLGFRRLKNLTGGINRWSRDVDPDVPLY